MSKGVTISLNPDETVNAFDFTCVKKIRVENLVNIFKAYTLVLSTMYVQHGRTISLYSLENSVKKGDEGMEPWERHVVFPDEILRLFRSRQRATGTESTPVVILRNGQIYKDLERDQYKDGNNIVCEVSKLNIVPYTSLDLQDGAEIVQVFVDIDNAQYTLI